MKLYICEKPSQAKDVAAVLKTTKRSNGYFETQDAVVTWCFGHLLEMSNPDDYSSEYKKWRFETLPILPDQWRMQVKRSGAKQFKIIKQLLGKHRHVVIATDADREGEMIAREILHLCGYTGAIERLWLTALDPASIRKALSNMKPDVATRPLYHAGLGRARADWLIGMNLTRAYTLLAKASGGTEVVSIGRVQTPTLKIIVDRDRLIEAFTPVPYYDLVIELDADGQLFKAKWRPGLSSKIDTDSENRCLDKAEAESVLAKVQCQAGAISSLIKKIEKRSPPLPFDLSTLQSESSKTFGLEADEVLEAVQALYEIHKATTYPRTDCQYLPVSQFEDASDILQVLTKNDSAWADHVPLDQLDMTLRSGCWNDKKITAHHAIIPTAMVFDIDALSDRELKVYSLIRQRYLMQFLPPFRYEATDCLASIEGHTFQAKGRHILDQGWRLLATSKSDKTDNEDDQTLPSNLAEGMTVTQVNGQVSDKTTKPPQSFTSGTLIAAMKNIARFVDAPDLKRVLNETSGIGTEATRASIINTLKERNYISRQGKYLVSTKFGRSLIANLPKSLTDPGTTALWEQVLDDIASGRGELDFFMRQQSDFISKMIDYLRQQNINLHYDQAERKPSPKQSLSAGNKCPSCSTGKISIKRIKSGANVGRAFYGCSNYPRCKSFQWAEVPQQAL